MRLLLLLLMVILSSCSVFQTETYQEKAIRQAMKAIFEKPQDLVKILNRSPFVKEGSKNYEKMPTFFLAVKGNDGKFEGREITFEELIKKAKKIDEVPDEKSIVSGVGYTWYFDYYLFSDEFDGGIVLLTISWHLNSYNCWSFGAISIPF